MAKSGTYKIAKQGSKGTAATTGFHCGLYTAIGLGEDWQFANDTAEHGCSTASTVYRDLSQRERTYCTLQGKAKGNFYPNVFGVAFLGLGFSDSVSGTTAKTHVMTAATAANDPWLSIIQDANADVSSTLERKAKDCRTTQIKVDADGSGVGWAAQFSGLSVGASSGTETSTTEPTYKMNRALGTFTLSFDPAGTPVTISSHSSNPPRSLSMTIDNPITTDDYPLWNAALGDLPRGEGIRAEGEFAGIPVQYSVYKQLMWGGASGTAPSATWLPCSIDMKFTTVAEITPGTPYSVQFTIPRAEVWLDANSFDRTGKEDGRWTLRWRLNATTGTPLTCTLVNTVSSY